MKEVQTSHNQGDIRYRMLRGKQCLCMSLTSVCRRLFKSVGIRDSIDLGCVLQNDFFYFV